MHSYRTLFHYVRSQRAYFVLIFALTVASSALIALQPWPMKLLADHVLGQTPLPTALDSGIRAVHLSPTPAVLITLITLGGLLLFGLNSVLEVLLTRSWTIAGQRMVYQLAEDLFARLQQRSLLFHSRNSVGDAISRITGDSWCVYRVADTLLFAPASAVLTIMGMIFLMLQLDVQLALLSLITAPLIVGASLFAGKPLRAAAKLKREVESRMQSHVQQTLTGIPVVQAFIQEDREQTRFEQFASAAVRAQQRSTLIGSFSSLASGLTATLGTALILWAGAQHVIAGTLTIGGILVFLVYLNSLQAQLKKLAGVYTALQGINASVDRVNEVFDAMPEVIEKAGARALPPIRGHVQFDQVTFGYVPGRPVLRNLSLEVLPGEIFAIVGSSGAGKTSLINLLPRFFDPWEGCVTIDGHDLRDLQLKSLRGQIALVLQEPFLFPLSIADNIAFGRASASRSEIESAARVANAHLFIERLPQGYDTVIGERGATLSGGERQRISIARALLKNAPILILDEPTSALDAETERSIFEALDRLMEGRTTFIIAHRLSTVRRASRIVVLRNGRVAESGTHEELLAHGDHYAQLHNIQFEPATTTASLTR